MRTALIAVLAVHLLTGTVTAADLPKHDIDLNCSEPGPLTLNFGTYRGPWSISGLSTTQRQYCSHARGNDNCSCNLQLNNGAYTLWFSGYGPGINFSVSDNKFDIDSKILSASGNTLSFTKDALRPITFVPNGIQEHWGIENWVGFQFNSSAPEQTINVIVGVNNPLGLGSGLSNVFTVTESGEVRILKDYDRGAFTIEQRNVVKFRTVDLLVCPSPEPTKAEWWTEHSGKQTGPQVLRLVQGGTYEFYEGDIGTPKVKWITTTDRCGVTPSELIFPNRTYHLRPLPERCSTARKEKNIPPCRK